EAPKYVYWGMKNRDALIRVPEFRGKAGARIEYRAPDPSSNPYLLFTVLLAAGMDGVKRNLEPPEPIEKDIYEYGLYRDLPTLPQTLEKALDALEEDKLLRSSLRLAGENFIKLKRQEWEDYATRRITDWEYEKYFDV
ncbi:MAG: glutamine synthetase, partial [Conexivisphaerales archaeon]